MSKKQFLILSSIIIGLVSALAAIALKTVTHHIQSLLTYNFHLSYNDYLYLVYPAAGILLTVTFIKIFLKDKFGKGAGHIMFYISKKFSNVAPSNMYSHLVTSALTVGFGGSVGLEAPIVVTGAAIGSNFGRIHLFEYKERTLLLACGSAAGIAAVFNAPIAGVMFALEVIIPELTIGSFIPLIISAATGALCSKIILKENILISFTQRYPFNYYNVPFYIILGLLCGFVSLYYAKVFTKIEHAFSLSKKSKFTKAIISGFLLAILVFLFPPLFGEGYEYIKLLATGRVNEVFQNSILSVLFVNNELFIVLLLLAISLLKVFASGITIGGGGNGGNFAPALFVGAFLGNFLAKFINLIFQTQLPASNFTLVGMAGILSGIMYAPFTGIFLIAEITGGYDLMIPLMVTASFAYVIVKHFEPYSMDMKDLAESGILIKGNKDKSILNLFNIKDLIETDFLVLKSTDKINDFIQQLKISKRNIFPVVDEENYFLGIVTMDNIRQLLLELNDYKDFPVIEMMSIPEVTVQVNDDIELILQKFEEYTLWNIPVLDGNKYIGFLSKSSILSKYRKKLIEDLSDNNL